MQRKEKENKKKGEKDKKDNVCSHYSFFLPFFWHTDL